MTTSKGNTIFSFCLNVGIDRVPSSTWAVISVSAVKVDLFGRVISWFRVLRPMVAARFQSVRDTTKFPPPGLAVDLGSGFREIQFPRVGRPLNRSPSQDST